MTKIQKNIAVANLVIDELHKDKPFVLKLEFDKAFKNVFGLPESVIESLKEVS